MRFEFLNENVNDLWIAICIQDDVITLFYNPAFPPKLGMILPETITHYCEFVHDKDPDHNQLHVEKATERPYFHHHLRLKHEVSIVDLKQIFELFESFSIELNQVAKKIAPIIGEVSFINQAAKQELMRRFYHYLAKVSYEKAEDIGKQEGLRRSGLYKQITEYEKVINLLRDSLAEFLFEGFDDLKKAVESMLASAYSGQATCYTKLGKLDEASVILKEALQIRSRVLGREDHSTKKIMNNLVFLEREKEKPEIVASRGRSFLFPQVCPRGFSAEIKTIMETCELASEPENVETLHKALRKLAAAAKEKEMLTLLKQCPIDINTKDSGTAQRTALHWAVIKAIAYPEMQKNYLDCIKVLIDDGAEDIPDASGKKPSEYAEGYEAILAALAPIISRETAGCSL